MDKLDTRQLQRAYEAFKNAPKYDHNSEELFCVCRKEDNGDLMVACDGCDEWFHFKCMKLDLKWQRLVKSYMCPFCDVLKGKGSSLWKRKCRMASCFLPIEDSSAFCGPKHAEKFWSSILNRFELNNCVDYDSNEQVYSGELNELFAKMESKTQLDSLGKELPSAPAQVLDDDPIVSSYQSLIEQLKSQKSKLVEQKSILTSKQKYLGLLKDHISHVNSALNSALTSEELKALNDSRKKSKKAKANSSKFDICGYDTHLEADPWEEISVDFVEDQAKIKSDYESIKNSEMEIDQESTALKSLCLNDRRKCIHSNWLPIERDDLISKLEILQTDLDAINQKIENYHRLITIEIWEKRDQQK